MATETTGLVGDFNGDRRKDLFWYGPGARPDHLWLGRADRNFTGVPVSVTRSYQPLIGDFNGDGRSDIFWYGPGAAVDRLWLGQPRGRFAGRTVSVTRLAPSEVPSISCSAVTTTPGRRDTQVKADSGCQAVIVHTAGASLGCSIRTREPMPSSSSDGGPSSLSSTISAAGCASVLRRRGFALPVRG